MITLEKLKSIIHYDPKTGIFTWLVARPGKAEMWARAGSNGPKGYRQLKLLGKSYREHRVAWFYMTGSWPKDQIDHINRIRDDNRWINLREVNNSENQRNANHRTGRSGLRGILTKNGKYIVNIKNGGDQIYVGCYSDENTAINARDDAISKFKSERNKIENEYVLGQM